MSNSNKSANPKTQTVTAMALAFAKLPASTQAKLSGKTLDKLEKTLVEAARETTVTIPSGPKAKAAQVEAVEILVKTLGNELHVTTPFSYPFLINAKTIPSRRYDKALGVTIFDAAERSAVLAVIHESFGKCKRPHVLNVDGKRTAITAGQQA